MTFAIATLFTIVVAGISCSYAYEDPFPPKNYDVKEAPILFEKFIKTYNKQYGTEEERRKRYAIFLDNLNWINKANNDVDGSHFGITEFSDLTHKEFEKCCLGFGTTKLKEFKKEYAMADPEKIFEDFIKTYDKTYKDEVEKNKRYIIFQDNLEEVKKRNLINSDHNFGINQFSDLTYEEFLKCCTGLLPNAGAENINTDINTNENPFPLQKTYDLKNAKKMFNKFIKYYKKKYADEDDKNKHYEVFKENLIAINKANEVSQGSYMGITEFADLTYDEFVKCCTGFPQSNKDYRHELYLNGNQPDEPCDVDAKWMRTIKVRGRSACHECVCHAIQGWVCQDKQGRCVVPDNLNAGKKEKEPSCKRGAKWIKTVQVGRKQMCKECICKKGGWQCSDKVGKCDFNLQGNICKKKQLDGKKELIPCMECYCDRNNELICEKITTGPKAEECGSKKRSKLRLPPGNTENLHGLQAFPIPLKRKQWGKVRVQPEWDQFYAYL